MATAAVLMSKKERENIITLFTKHRTLSFSQIERGTTLRSNHLVYFLKQLQEEGVLEKDGMDYKLTLSGQRFLPAISHLTGKETPPLAVVVSAIVDGKKILLLQREKRPFQGYWGMIGGKLQHGETIIDAAIREAKEETGLDVIFDSFHGLCHEHVKESGVTKHSFLLFLCKMRPVGGTIKTGTEGRVAWFDIKTLAKEKIIPSDLWMIQNMLPKKAPLIYSLMDDKGESYSFESKIY